MPDCPSGINIENLRELAYKALLDLSTQDGINASGKDEIYGCIFGRDSAITILKILKAHSKKQVGPLIEIARRALLTLVSLQGKEFNIESGEEPGKFIHEFRKDKYEHLVASSKPWYIYPDGFLRNYDSIDSTPLNLIAIYRYYAATQDGEFLMSVLPAVEAGLNWIISFGDKDKDTLVEFELSTLRNHGGLTIHSWADSSESLRFADGTMPKYPIASCEAQAFAWLAFKLWASFYLSHSPDFARKLLSFADKLKYTFNQKFIFKDQEKGYYFIAQALDGDKNKITTITGTALMCLWSTFNDPSSGLIESIIEQEYLADIVKRAFLDDLFDCDGGIRTMSMFSPTFNPTETSYHNGSFWPMLNGLVHEGLEVLGFYHEADLLKQASLKPIEYFKSPIELYIKGSDGGYLEYRSKSGRFGCRVQAWSAAVALDWLSS